MQKSANAKIVAIVGALSLQSTPALAKSLAECVSEGGRHTPAAVAIACIAGKKYSFERYKREDNDPKGNDINGHEFRSQPINVSKNGNETTITGSVAHMIPFRRNQEVRFEITKVGTNLISIKSDIDHGGWGKITGSMASIIASIPGVPLPDDQAKKFSERINDSLVAAHDWSDVAKAIIVEIAIRAN